eukprot:gene11290-18926_t
MQLRTSVLRLAFFAVAGLAISASLSNAQEDTAVAESDQREFDYFMFVRFRFTIHGLWPNYADGKWPEYCDRGEPFDEDKLDDIMTNLKEEWPSFMNADDGFWSHEWARHGTCAEKVLGNEHGFFSTVLELQHKYDIAVALKDKGIHESNEKQYKRTDIEDAIFDYYVDWPEGPVWMCIGKDLKPFDCKHPGYERCDMVTIPTLGGDKSEEDNSEEVSEQSEQDSDSEEENSEKDSELSEQDSVSEQEDSEQSDQDSVSEKENSEEDSEQSEQDSDSEEEISDTDISESSEEDSDIFGGADKNAFEVEVSSSSNMEGSVSDDSSDMEGSVSDDSSDSSDSDDDGWFHKGWSHHGGRDHMRGSDKSESDSDDDSMRGPRSHEHHGWGTDNSESDSDDGSEHGPHDHMHHGWGADNSESDSTSDDDSMHGPQDHMQEGIGSDSSESDSTSDDDSMHGHHGYQHMHGHSFFMCHGHLKLWVKIVGGLLIGLMAASATLATLATMYPQLVSKAKQQMMAYCPMRCCQAQPAEQYKVQYQPLGAKDLEAPFAANANRPPAPYFYRPSVGSLVVNFLREYQRYGEVMLGQCGNQLGSSLFQTLAGELGSGEYAQHSVEEWFRPLKEDPRSQEIYESRKYVARSVLIDMEPKVVNAARTAARTSGGWWQYPERGFLCMQSGAGNNWAHGFHGYGPTVGEAALELVRKEVEVCDVLGGFMLLQSMAGGTGAGLGTYVAQALRDEYLSSNVVNCCIWPYESGEVIVQSYNTLFTLSRLADVSDGLILMENEALHRTAVKLYNIKRPSFNDMNTIAARTLSNILLPSSCRDSVVSQSTPSNGPTRSASKRGSLSPSEAAGDRRVRSGQFGISPGGTSASQTASTSDRLRNMHLSRSAGQGSAADRAPQQSSPSFHLLADLVSHLCCHPHYRLLALRSLPQVPAASIDFTTTTWPSMLRRLKQMFVTGSFLEEGMEWMPMPKSRLAAAAGVGGHVGHLPEWKGNQALASWLVVRGPGAGESDVSDFVDPSWYPQWAVDPFKVTCSPYRFNGCSMAAALLSNDQSCVSPMERMLQRAVSMLASRAFVHQYEKYGMDEQDFLSCFSHVEDMVQRYKNLGGPQYAGSTQAASQATRSLLFECSIVPLRVTRACALDQVYHLAPSDPVIPLALSNMQLAGRLQANPTLGRLSRPKAVIARPVTQNNGFRSPHVIERSSFLAPVRVAAEPHSAAGNKRPPAPPAEPLEAAPASNGSGKASVADAGYDQFCIGVKSGANLIPIVRRIFSDQLTPVLGYRCLVNESDIDAPSFLLESVVNGDTSGRYSFIGAMPAMEVLATKGKTTVLNHTTGERTVTEEKDPMCIPEAMSRLWRPYLSPEIPKGVFTGGFVGYAGYDTVRYVYSGKLPFASAPTDDRNLPDMQLALYNDVVVFDQATKIVYVVSWVHVDEKLCVAGSSQPQATKIVYVVSWVHVDKKAHSANKGINSRKINLVHWPTATIQTQGLLSSPVMCPVASDTAALHSAYKGNKSRKTHLVSSDAAALHSAYEDGKSRSAHLVHLLTATRPIMSAGNNLNMSLSQKPSSLGQSNMTKKPSSLGQSDMTKEEFLSAVAKTKEHIVAGDVFQLVMSQRFERRSFCTPFEIYRALRVVNPSPYMVYMQTRGCVIVSSSPEILCRVDQQGVVTNRPLAGTRARGKTPQEDAALEKDLLSDGKECSEHVMLVDLGRNDVGKVAEHGSVSVDKLMVVERYSHVMHISSTVTGTLKKELDAWDALRAALPAGTVSGAPKVRAMQIIDTLEVNKRGPYGGGVGHVSFTGGMDMALGLRTIVVQTAVNDARYQYKRGDSASPPRREWVVHLQAGAGLVADSVPESEFEETVNKAAALGRAVDLAEQAFSE